MNDKLDAKIFIGDPVAYGTSGYVGIGLGIVLRFGKKQVVIQCGLKSGGFNSTVNRYPNEIVKIDAGGNNELS